MSEADLQRALLFRSTLYKSLSENVLSALTATAKEHGLDVKPLATAFDKFMTVNR
jgi:hypothetical protein